MTLNPKVKGYTYDFRERTYKDRAGQKATPDRFVGGSARRGARKARAGTSTLRRAILIKTLIAETNEGRQAEIFGRVLDWADSLALLG